MSDEDDAQYRRRINSILEEYGFGWVVAQVENQVAAGKLTSKQVSETEIFQAADERDFREKSPRKRRASLITSEPYSETERLDLLLNAIEAALIDRAALEQNIFDDLEKVAIRFAPEEETPAEGKSYLGKRHEINASARSTAMQIERETAAVLSQLRVRNSVST